MVEVESIGTFSFRLGGYGVVALERWRVLFVSFLAGIALFSWLLSPERGGLRGLVSPAAGGVAVGVACLFGLLLGERPAWSWVAGGLFEWFRRKAPERLAPAPGQRRFLRAGGGGGRRPFRPGFGPVSAFYCAAAVVIRRLSWLRD